MAFKGRDDRKERCTQSETNKLKCVGSWKILLKFLDSAIRQFSCLKKHKKCGLVMIKLAHKAPQECGNCWANRNVVMALHDIELKNFCQYWSKNLSDSYGFIVAVGPEVFLSFLSHSLTLPLSFSFSGSGHVLDTLSYNVNESKAHRAFAIYGRNGNCQCYNRLYQLV